jgi:osmotically-inducible protein OsmY
VATASLTETDVRVRDAVMRQLEWDPEVDASAVGVAAKDGTVTLTGYIDSYAGKLAAERAAKRVHGVRGVANDVDVRLKLDRTDVDIANDAVRALELRSTIPDGVQAVVHNAHVTLTGKVNWLFQKREAEKAVRHIRGVRSVVNYIEVAPHAVERDVRRRIVQALHQNADVDAHHITVTLSGDTGGSELHRRGASGLVRSRRRGRNLLKGSGEWRHDKPGPSYSAQHGPCAILVSLNMFADRLFHVGLHAPPISAAQTAHLAFLALSRVRSFSVRFAGTIFARTSSAGGSRCSARCAAGTRQDGPSTDPHRNHMRPVIGILRGASTLTSSHYVSDRRERDLMEQVVRG